MILFVGDDIVDLYPTAQIFYNVQRANIGSLSNRSVSFTTAFKAPWTENNERIFGFAKHEGTTNPNIYMLRECRIENNGSAITKQSVLYITKSSDKEFNLQLYETIFDYFLSVNDKNISDINPIGTSAWRAADIDTARLATDGLISALIFWGITFYHEDYFLPSFYYHTLINAILEFTGLEIEGDILTDARFTDLVVPFPSKFEYPETYYRQFNFYTPRMGDQLVSGSTGESIIFGYNPSHYGHGKFFARVSLGGLAFGSGNNLVLHIRKNGTLVATMHMASPPAPGVTREIEYEDFVEPGDTFNVYVFSDATVGPGITYTIVGGGGASSYMLFTPDAIVHRDEVNWNALWPVISCTDLLKDFFNRFAIIPNQVDNRLILKTLEEIIANVPGAVDWSSKLVNVKEKEISFKTDYAQSNLFTYVNKANDADLGTGSIEIANNTLALRKTLFGSVFGNSKMIQTYSWFMADVPAFDPTILQEDPEFSTGRRIVAADDLDQTDEGTIVLVESAIGFNLTVDLLTANTRIKIQNVGAGTVTLVEGVGVNISNSTFAIPSGYEVILDYVEPSYPNIYYNQTTSEIIIVNEDPGLRLLTLKDRTVEGQIVFDSIARTDYKLGYFVDPDLDKDTGFQYFVDQFYPSLTSALQRNKLITKEYLLTENDIFSYDPHKMMYDGQGYYLINKIVNFYPGKVTKVELFKCM